MVQRVSSTDDDERMPPEHEGQPFNADQIAVLKALPDSPYLMLTTNNFVNTAIAPVHRDYAVRAAAFVKVQALMAGGQ
jgi:hypothetical protein